MCLKLLNRKAIFWTINQPLAFNWQLKHMWILSWHLTYVCHSSDHTSLSPSSQSLANRRRLCCLWLSCASSFCVQMHPLAHGVPVEYFDPGLYPGLPPRLAASVPNTSPVPNSLPPPSPAQSAVLPSHTYVNVDNIMHSSFPRDPSKRFTTMHCARLPCM